MGEKKRLLEKEDLLWQKKQFKYFHDNENNKPTKILLVQIFDRVRKDRWTRITYLHFTIQVLQSEFSLATSSLI